jgi:hypothetical protein
VQFAAEQWMRMAVVWKNDGIPGLGGKTLALLINNKVVASSTQKVQSLLPLRQYFVVGAYTACPFVSGAMVCYSGASGDIDDLAVWNYAKIAPNCITPPAGLVSWWKGNLTADDFLGLNNGSLRNGATYATGMVRDAFSFNDSTQAYVSVPDSPSLALGTGDFSMDAWIKTSSKKDIGTIQHKLIGNIGYGYHFFIRNGGIGPGVQFGDGSNVVTVGADTFLADGQFHHVAVSVRRQAPDGIRIFVDGNLVATKDPRSANGSLDNNVPFLIGGHNIDAWRSFSGLIDEFQLYKRALTDNEVKSIYLAGSAGQCPEELSAMITDKGGLQNARGWTVTLTNTIFNSAGVNAQIDGLTLSQSSGAACAPVITNPATFPLVLGNILANGKASGTVTLDFTGCPSNARFTATIPFSGNNGAVSGSKTLTNQFR